jgi:peptide/nickel transport system substrate-binding protein
MTAPSRVQHRLPVPPSHRIGRRALLAGAAALGLGATGLSGLPGIMPATVAGAQAEPNTLTIPASPNDFDPHSQYDYNSVVAVRGMYEGLLALKGSATDAYEGLIAESWETNDDQSVWTFHLREGVTFHDGSPCDAAAVVASYQRLLTMQKGPGTSSGGS